MQNSTVLVASNALEDPRVNTMPAITAAMIVIAYIKLMLRLDSSDIGFDWMLKLNLILGNSYFLHNVKLGKVLKSCKTSSYCTFTVQKRDATNKKHTGTYTDSS